MGEPLRALLIEDSEDDATLIVNELKHGGYDVDYERIDTSDAIEEALGRREWDIILCDHAMPHICAPEALQIVMKRRPETPFIIVSGWITDDLADASVKSGARKFVRKNNLKELVPAIRKELVKSKKGKPSKKPSKAGKGKK